MFAKVLPRFQVALFVAVAANGLALNAEADEFAAAVYGGKAWTGRTDVRLQQPGGTDLRFEQVAWDDASFEAPYYWGARLTWWPTGDAAADAAGWGAALDFTHAKASARPDQSVQVSGTRGGAAVDAVEPIADTFTTLSFTHGLNTLILTAMYRWSPWRTGAFGAVRPYAGAGYGVALPHVEIGVGGQNSGEYRITGAAYEGLAGLEFKAYARVSIFVEYKLSQTDITTDVPGGGSVRLRPWTHHAVLGAAYLF